MLTWRKKGRGQKVLPWPRPRQCPRNRCRPIGLTTRCLGPPPSWRIWRWVMSLYVLFSSLFLPAIRPPFFPLPQCDSSSCLPSSSLRFVLFSSLFLPAIRALLFPLPDCDSSSSLPFSSLRFVLFPLPPCDSSSSLPSSSLR